MIIDSSYQYLIHNMRGKGSDLNQRMIRRKQYDRAEDYEEGFNRNRNQGSNRYHNRNNCHNGRDGKPAQKYGQKQQIDYFDFGSKKTDTARFGQAKCDYRASEHKHHDVEHIKRSPYQLHREQNQELKEMLDHKIEQYQQRKPKEDPRPPRKLPQPKNKRQKSKPKSESWLSDQQNKKEVKKPNKQEQRKVSENKEVEKSEQNVLQQAQKQHNESSAWLDDNEQTSLNRAHIQQNSIQLSGIIADDNLFEDQPSQELEPEKSELSQEAIRETLKGLVTKRQISVWIKFTAEQNIQEFRIKQIQLVALQATVKVSPNKPLSIEACPGISSQQLQQYIQIVNIANSFPRILVNQPESVSHMVEGEQQEKPINGVAELQICRIRYEGEQVQQNEDKVDKRVLMVRSVVARCMECGTKSEIMVSSSTNQVVSACSKCSGNFMGKIEAVWLKQMQ